MAKKVVIACGGTGGHLFPGLAVGEELLRRGHEVMLIISEKEIDALAVEGRDDFRIEKMQSMGMPSPLSPAMLPFAVKFLSGIRQCNRLYRDFRPDVVLGMGGFTSTGPILSGRMAGAMTFIHESNAIPGKANRLNAKLAKVTLLGVAECRPWLPKSRCEVVGTPVRTSLTTSVDPQKAFDYFGLESGRKTLLVMGGSQGASAVNHAVCRGASTLAKLGIQVVHLAGDRDANVARKAYEDAGVTAYVAPFLHEMELAYAVADLAVARSGASSLSELAYFGLPSILVPYPFAAEDHQSRNAEIFSGEGGGVVLDESAQLDQELTAEIERLVSSDEILNKMAEQMRKADTGKAAARIADCIEENSQEQ